MAEMSVLGSLAWNKFGGDTDTSGSALGLENAFPMPSELNRAGAIIAGQEDPAIKQQAINLQTAVSLATLKQHQQEMLIKQSAQFSEILKTAKDFMPFIPEEERPKLAKSIAEKAKKAGHPLSDENLIAAYLNKPDDGALAMANLSRGIATGKSPDAAIADAIEVTKDPELRKHLLTGFFQLAGKKQTVAEAAVTALSRGAPLPGFSLEETKKIAGGFVEGQKLTPQQEAFAKLTPAEQRQVVLREGQPDKPLTTKEKQNIAGQIMGEARRQVEGQFRTILGAIDLSSLGKTAEERGRKFREMINNTAAEIARERGFDFAELRKEKPKFTAKQARDALLQKRQSGEIMSASEGEQFLIDQGIPASQAQFIMDEIQKKK